MAKYSYRDIARMTFTEEDLARAVTELSVDDRYKTVATLTVDYVKGKALRDFGVLCETLDGFLKTDYTGLTIRVPRRPDELRATALHYLKQSNEYEALRDTRAAEQEIAPVED